MVEAGMSSPFGLWVRLEQDGQPVQAAAVTFEVYQSAGGLFPSSNLQGVPQSTIQSTTDAQGYAGCQFRAPLQPAYCWIKATTAQIAPVWFLMIVGGGDGAFPSNPSGVDGVEYAEDSDGDGDTDAQELEYGYDPKNPSSHSPDWTHWSLVTHLHHDYDQWSASNSREWQSNPNDSSTWHWFGFRTSLLQGVLYNPSPEDLGTTIKPPVSDYPVLNVSTMPPLLSPGWQEAGSAMWTSPYANPTGMVTEWYTSAGESDGVTNGQLIPRRGWDAQALKVEIKTARARPYDQNWVMLVQQGMTEKQVIEARTLTIPAGSSSTGPMVVYYPPVLEQYNSYSISLLPVEVEVPDIQDTGPVLASNGTGSGTPTDPAAPAGSTSGSGAAPPGGSYEDPVKKATELKIAQMEGIYSGGTLTRDALDANHSLKIDNDRDRFRVRIPSIGNANAGPVFVKIATEGATDPDHNDNPTIVEMKSNGFDGDWVTDWQLLVSQHTSAPSAPSSGAPPQTAADDKYTNAEIAADDQDQAQGQIGDRTHVAELGSEVVIKAIKIGASGSWTDMNLKIPVKVKREIPITFVKMNDAAADPTRDLKLANERWAQLGIKFTSQGVTPMAVPAPLTNSDIMASDTTSTGVTFGAQPKKLADTYNAMPGATSINGTRIVVFYCKDTRYPQANTPRGQDISGFATFSAWMNGTYQGGGSSPTAPGYENVIFLSENHWKPFTLAHELGHLLTNEGHFGQTNNPTPTLNADYPTPSPSAHQTEHNLMRLGGTSHIDSIGASKRLIDFQKKMVDEADNGIAK